MSDEKPAVSNFIRQIIVKDNESGKHGGKVVTRFPPEPNGHLHVGHAKSITLNFGLAADYGGRCHLRFDDTNPEKEEIEYIESIQEDIKWLGFDWGEHLYYASDYYPQLYDTACKMIQKGHAFVDDCTVDEIRKLRGGLTEPGKNSPFRDRTPEENLDLFQRMKAGEFEDGSKVLRAKIDMQSPNMNMRDPLMYRIKKVDHPRTGSDWCIYPLYDYAHGLSDMIEGITHSICTLEFEDHRPLYEWFLESAEAKHRPQQIEFARLSLDYTLTSKRKVLAMVEQKLVSGWDDPRLFTIKGLRRRGYRAEGIRLFSERIGVSKRNSVLSFSDLEQAIRDDLDGYAPRAMAVLDPIKVTITNYPDAEVEELEGPVHPKYPERGNRKIPFSKTVCIDREDFMETPPNNKYRRLSTGGQVRLRYAYVITCNEVIKDDSGKVVELKCTYDVGTKSGVTPEGQKKVKGIIHWVSAEHGIPCEVRVYDRLFNVENPSGDDYLEHLNPESLQVNTQAFVEPSLKGTGPEAHFQFERLGYFTTDRVDSTGDKLVFNRTATLRETWAQKS